MKYPSLNHQQIGVVSDFNDFIDLKFHGEMNAICWYRNLIGNFKEIVDQLVLHENVTEISVADLLALRLSHEGNLARQVILKDMQRLTDIGALPCLNLIKNYIRDDELDFISTDVYSYHIDRSPIETDTFLCTYYGAASEILPHDQVEQKILVPEIRQKLKNLHHDSENDFEDFLEEHFFDLHFQPKPHAQPISLGLGHIWRLAVDHPTQHVLPCVHRAPFEKDDQYRLLLIC